MATLLESVTWPLYEATLKNYLGISGNAEDENLKAWLNAAVVSGDSYMENPFVDSDDIDIAIPDGVLVGVWEWMRIARRLYISESAPGATGVKTRDLSENYAGAGMDPLSMSLNSAKPYWLPYRCRIWR